MLPLEVPVIIVGAGPAGLMSALLLERLGIQTLLIERRPGPQRAPAAHVVNARTFEICRAAGVDMDAVTRASIPPEDGGFVDWVRKLGGERLGRLPFERQGEDQLEVTPTPLRNLSQNKFEPLLIDALGTPPRWNCQWESAVQDETGVTVEVRDLESDEVSSIRCRYLLGADGAGSRVRKSLEIPMLGPDSLQNFVMVHFAAALRDRLGSPPSVLNFVTDSREPCVIVVHNLDAESTMMVAYDAEKESVEDYTVERCAGLLRDALEEPDLDFKIETISTWAMTAQVAERYRDGRIFLVGDSAHRFPPTGGLGLNSGVQDAHNLAWKLAWVLNGEADAALLDSYESERKPVAQNNADQSLKNAVRLFEVPQALAEKNGDVSAAIENQAEHFDMPGLQLGFSYAPGAEPPDPRVFEPSGEPGRRVPHAWIEDEGVRRSALDLVPLGRFLLLVGPEGSAWLDAARPLGSERLATHRVSAEEMPALSGWLECAGIDASGALLVRPDQHIAWRAQNDGECEGLAAAFESALRGLR